MSITAELFKEVFGVELKTEATPEDTEAGTPAIPVCYLTAIAPLLLSANSHIDVASLNYSDGFNSETRNLAEVATGIAWSNSTDSSDFTSNFDDASRDGLGRLARALAVYSQTTMNHLLVHINDISRFNWTLPEYIIRTGLWDANSGYSSPMKNWFAVCMQDAYLPHYEEAFNVIGNHYEKLCVPEELSSFKFISHDVPERTIVIGDAVRKRFMFIAADNKRNISSGRDFAKLKAHLKQAGLKITESDIW